MERLHIANQILETTYALVNEPRLFLGVIDNIYGAFDLTMDGMLQNNNIQFDPGNHAAKIILFEKIHNDNKITSFIAGLRATIEQHSGASVEFVRNEQLIISDNDYNLTALSADNLKKALNDAHKCIDALYS